MKPFIKIMIKVICLFIFNKKLRKKVRAYLKSKYIEKAEKKSNLKEFKKILKQFESENNIDEIINQKQTHNKVIWQLWMQGENNMPPIVQEAIKSVKKYTPGYKHILVTEDNLDDYVNIPQSIKDKHKSGIISFAHYSDIIRVHLLNNHGGIWIDATVLLLEEIPNEILDSDYFMFRHPNDPKEEYSLPSNWFIVSNANHPITYAMTKLLDIYWAKHDKALDYFFFHWLFYTLTRYNKKFKEIYDSMYYDNSPHRADLFYHLVEGYDEKTVKTILNKSFIHKLTYKKPFYNIEEILTNLEDYINDEKT